MKNYHSAQTDPFYGQAGSTSDLAWRRPKIENLDARWIQRLSHYSKALKQLRKFIQKGELNELEQQGLIQAFEYTYELDWNALKDFFEAQGETQVYGSRDSFRLAFNRELVDDGEVWMDMVKSRSLTSHTYNEGVAGSIAGQIQTRYFTAFEALESAMKVLEKTSEK